MEECKITSKYKILTPSGFQPFFGIRKLQKKSFIEIILENKIKLKCTLEHKIMTEYGWMLAKDLTTNNSIETKDGFIEILKINSIQNDIAVYDLIEVKNHSYLTNNIISHNCSFIGSANTLIDAEKLNTLTYGKIKNKNAEGFVIYEEPIKGIDSKGTIDREYFITVDVARGQGGDNSAFCVFDISSMPYKMVARFKNNTVSPLLLPSYIKSVGKKYNNAHVLVEVNDIGSQVADILHYDLEYENLVKSVFKGTKGQTITDSGGKRMQLGIRTTQPVKKLGCAVLKNMIEQDKLLVDDSDTIDELTTFVADGQSFSADEGHTDDLVMCLVLFAWATRQDFFEAITNKDIRLEMYEKEIEKIESEIIPMIIDDGGTDTSEWDGNDRWYIDNARKNNQYWLF